MKITGLIVCMLILGSASASTKYNVLHKQGHERVDVGVIVEDLLNYLFNWVGNIDPINVSELGFNVLGKKVSIKNLHAEGFSNIVPEITIDIELTSINFKLGATIPKIDVSVEEWESTIPPFYGKGTTGLDLEEVSFLLSFDYVYFNGFQPCKVSTGIKHGAIQLTGLHNNETLSQEIVAEHDIMFNTLYPSEEFQNMIENRVNSLLGVYFRKSLKYY